MVFLKWLRIAVAAVFFSAIGALFLDFTGTVPTAWHRLAHVQITSAILEFGGIGLKVCLIWIVLTLLFGRIYCSTVCPLGIMQDVFSRMAKTVRGKKGKHRFRPGMTKTRLAFLGIFIASFVALPVGVTLLDPYSNFGRIAVAIFRPVFLFGNNFMAGAGFDGFRFKSIYAEPHTVIVALTVLLLVGTLSALFGRIYCNTICPVGALLGLLSRFSLFKIRLKHDCVSCGLCEKACKGECIDSRGKTVDASRCVACFNCLGTCKRNSVLYSVPLRNVPEPMLEPQPENMAAAVPVENSSGADRRSFLQWSFFSLLIPSLAGSLGAARSGESKTKTDLPSGTSRVGYEITFPILPPGAESREHFRRRCTGCHLCVSKCPENIIRPSTTELGLSGFLQPVLKFDHGFCNYDCTICTEVCPSHALVPKEKAEKHRLQIGRVVFLKENCVVETQGSNCGACAEHCPTGAVAMVPFGKPEQALTIPVIDADLCVGCGACEHICPVRPYRAIYVDGLEKHAQAKPAYDPEAKQQEVKLDDFGF